MVFFRLLRRLLINLRGSLSILRRASDTSLTLTPTEAASTIFRFFRSDHVADLRTIVRTATFLLLFYIIAMLMLFLMEGPAARLSLSFKDVLTYIGGAVSIYGLICGWAYLSASARLGVVDLFACEIITICRVGVAFDIGKSYVEQYKQGPPKHSGATVKFVSQEEYFPVFDSNSKDLQLLESSIVNNITAFYTYMKATRDALRRLQQVEVEKASPTSPDLDYSWHNNIFNVIYMLFLAHESGRKAIHELIEYEPIATEQKMVILITELKCYSFLLKYFEDKHDQLRHSRLKVRELSYRNDVPLLCLAALSHSADKYWCTALLTVPTLGKRYQETFGELPPVPEGFPTDDEIEDAAQRALRAPDKEALTRLQAILRATQLSSLPPPLRSNGVLTIKMTNGSVFRIPDDAFVFTDDAVEFKDLDGRSIRQNYSEIETVEIGHN
jgi:hypothetical protein